MRNRNLDHKDDWATPDYLKKEKYEEYALNFDPCPLHARFDALEPSFEWGTRNFINPPYSLALKTRFVIRTIEEMHKGKFSLMLLPAATSTKLFHNHILPNCTKMYFQKGRISFIGIVERKISGKIAIANKGLKFKGRDDVILTEEHTVTEYVNWHLWDKKPPLNSIMTKQSGMHDSMWVEFDGLGWE